ncbi:LOW QUALITY PROTEIN: uncharacterized protein LOC108829930 [Raphanus sativus]|uniref:LOW QUALITY PROTEIN: uncharacterized protein LOC108829930 n=1 Tax=Raphanus sativus TaxID=3726 RepID=A0A6J0LHU6_RAPSA|nr:LOW QUALITY PROTEIN: uncharacterized protein LOC108829930 [Raphanus sativus]
MLTSQLKAYLAIRLSSSSTTSYSSLSPVYFQLQMSGSDDHLRWGTTAPLAAEDEGEGRVQSSVNAVPFCLVATAVLISIFLLLALFERFMFIRQTTSPPSFHQKVPPFASPKIGVCEREISVLMPGEEVPTFIAQPCPPSYSRSF